MIFNGASEKTMPTITKQAARPVTKPRQHINGTMLSRGVPVPACWDHQDIEAGDAPADADAQAEWKRRRIT